MPAHPAVGGAIIVLSVAVAAAIAVYESPQARQFAEDCRRRIAIALHSLGNELHPGTSQNPLFNRPEDAEGFLQSRGAIASGEPGVVADEDSARRQREELMYWNAVRLEKLAEQEKQRAIEGRTRSTSRGSNFDDFLQQDKDAEKGTYVYNTGADAAQQAESGLRHRGVRGLQRGSVYANPFGDEHNIYVDEQRAIDASLMSPDQSEQFEVMSQGIYSANEDPLPQHTRAQTSSEPAATIAQQLLIDTSESAPDPPVSIPDAEPWSQDALNFTNMAPASSSNHSNDEEAFASIHAWADNANNSFYSPLPTTPRARTPSPQHLATPPSPAFSDPPVSIPGSGDVTPTDTMSLAGSGDEIWAPRSGATSEGGDVLSIDGDGIHTPGSWTEVGSVVSENDLAVHAS